MIDKDCHLGRSRTHGDDEHLAPRQDEGGEAQTADGRYANASDYVRDLIRKDQGRCDSIAKLQALIDEGDASGDPIDLDLDAFLAEMSAKHGR
jgi:antitoxin ParD1/3/4